MVKRVKLVWLLPKVCHSGLWSNLHVNFFISLFGQRPRRGPEGTLVLYNRGNLCVRPSVDTSVPPWLGLKPGLGGLNPDLRGLKPGLRGLKPGFRGLN